MLLSVGSKGLGGVCYFRIGGTGSAMLSFEVCRVWAVYGGVTFYFWGLRFFGKWELPAQCFELVRNCKLRIVLQGLTKESLLVSSNLCS